MRVVNDNGYEERLHEEIENCRYISRLLSYCVSILAATFAVFMLGIRLFIKK